MSDTSEKLIAVLTRIALDLEDIKDALAERPPPRLSIEEFEERERVHAAEGAERLNAILAESARHGEAARWEV